MSVDIQQLRDLPISEKLQIVEALWDDIAHSEIPIELQPWQFQKAQQRAQELNQNPTLAIEREELWRRVNG